MALMDDPNMIWIEPNANVEDKHAAARYANKVLDALGIGEDGVEFWWSEKHSMFCLTTAKHGGFIQLTDNGHWFTPFNTGEEQ
jgi:hypothetical protein